MWLSAWFDCVFNYLTQMAQKYQVGLAICQLKEVALFDIAICGEPFL